MNIEELISGIAGAESQSALEEDLHRFIEAMGFASYCFADAGTAQTVPFHIGSNQIWDAEYAGSDFASVDHCLAHARRTNTPFSWGSVPLPEKRGKRLPGAFRVMEAAADHGFQEGMVVPFHFVDEIGRPRSMLCALYWTDSAADFKKSLEDRAWQIHIYLLYWMQRSINLRLADTALSKDQHRDSPGIFLTDRERDVLNWAARGKTAASTAEILGISTETVDTHVKNAVRRLGAGNKTHAVAKAIMLNAIEI